MVREFFIAEHETFFPGDASWKKFCNTRHYALHTHGILLDLLSTEAARILLHCAPLSMDRELFEKARATTVCL